MTTITRRNFLKVSAFTTGAVITLGKGTALAEESSSTPPNQSYYWCLKCTEDPDSNQTSSIPSSSLGGLFFASLQETPFDPPGPGDGSNCKLYCRIHGAGPKKGDYASSFTVAADLFGGIKILNNDVVEFGPTLHAGDGTNKISSCNTTIAIDSNTGVVTLTPNDGNDTSTSTVHWNSGSTVANLVNSTAFTIEGNVSHDFRSAYSGELGLEAQAKFATIYEVKFTGKVKIDINNLGELDSKPKNLEWSVVKVKVYTNEHGMDTGVEEIHSISPS